MNVGTTFYVNTSNSSGDISDKNTNANLLVGLEGHIYCHFYFIWIHHLVAISEIWYID